MQTSNQRTVSRISGLLALGALLAIPGLAQLNPGTVLLSTPAGAGTAVDFSSNPIPADFFCPGSAPFAGVVPLQGVPLATNPPGIAGSADTVIEHLTPGVFSGGITNFTAVLRAMHLRSSNTLQIVCGDGTTTFWQVDVCACGPQPETTVSAQIDLACNNCGTANGTLPVRTCVTFTNVNTGQRLGPIPQNVLINLTNTRWCFRPGLGETVATQPFQVDTDCDGQPDLPVQASANFHTGYTCGSQGKDCLALFGHLTQCHPAGNGYPKGHQHCFNPVCDRRQ